METFGNDLLHGLSEISATDKSVVIQDNTKDNGYKSNESCDVV